MVKLHLGCGRRNFGKDWDHIDQADFPHIDSHDVTVLPYSDSSVDVIYACHLIAYFDREEIIMILEEWRRVLKKGGILRLATPNWDVLRKMAVPMLGPLYGKMGEPVIYHKTVYTFDSLRRLLTDAGFHYAKRYDHTKTDHAAFDDHSAAYHKGKLISLNIQCYA